MQVVYHTATLMPSTETETQFNKKKRHIGNDYVAIVYNGGGNSYTMGQFIYAHIIGAILLSILQTFSLYLLIVEPLDFGSNRISAWASFYFQVRFFMFHRFI